MWPELWTIYGWPVHMLRVEAKRLRADLAASYRADEARGCVGRGRRMAEIRRAGEPAETLWDEFEWSMG